jgi:hypothetical protein
MNKVSAKALSENRIAYFHVGDFCLFAKQGDSLLCGTLRDRFDVDQLLR